MKVSVMSNGIPVIKPLSTSRRSIAIVGVIAIVIAITTRYASSPGGIQLQGTESFLGLDFSWNVPPTLLGLMAGAAAFVGLWSFLDDQNEIGRSTAACQALRVLEDSYGVKLLPPRRLASDGRKLNIQPEGYLASHIARNMDSTEASVTARYYYLDNKNLILDGVIKIEDGHLRLLERKADGELVAAPRKKILAVEL